MTKAELIDQLCEKFGEKVFEHCQNSPITIGEARYFLRELLSEAVVVKGDFDPVDRLTYWNEKEKLCDTHCALLIAITEINQAPTVADVIRLLRKQPGDTYTVGEYHEMATRLEKFGVRS